VELVEAINEALVNAQAFSGVGEVKGSIAYQNFNLFFHWYYFSNIEAFAPSKFIGYKNTNLENYRSEGRTGTNTQKVLSKWFVKVDPASEKHSELRSKLESFAASIGKQISSKTFKGTGGIYLLSDEYAGTDYPDEVTQSGLREGATKQVTVNAFERSARARAECIEHYGAKCCVCKFEFQNRYGKELGAGFIHVHHVVDIAQVGKEYEVNPIEDLMPVCPNCHAMLHKRKPTLHPDELKKIIDRNITKKSSGSKKPRP
jgi:5-methylcytosine-specific restriction protein A